MWPMGLLLCVFLFFADIRDITRDKVLMYMFENQGREDIHDSKTLILCLSIETIDS